MARVAIDPAARRCCSTAPPRSRQGGGCRRTRPHAAGARLVVFPETFVPGYPAWIWRLAAGRRHGPDRAASCALAAESVDLAARRSRAAAGGGARSTRSRSSAASTSATLASAAARSTTRVVVIGPDGALLEPPPQDDADQPRAHGVGLRRCHRPQGGRHALSAGVGALICWESYMPLARYALYAQGVEILRRADLRQRRALHSPRCSTSHARAAAG